MSSRIKRLARSLAKWSKEDTVAATIAEQAIYQLRRSSRSVLSDRRFLQLYYHFHKGRLPSLSRPRTFSDKLQWLKLNYRPRILTRLVDKAAVRGFVGEAIGEDVLIPSYGVFDHVDEIQEWTLPKAFVLKPTHGSGWVIICEDAERFDWRTARHRLSTWLKRNYYYHAREWAYRDVPRRVIAEALLTDVEGRVPVDYKIFCFGGRPAFVQVDFDRFTDHRRNFYDLHWNRLNLGLLYPQAGYDIPAPKRLGEMLEMAQILTGRFPFCRVDFYEVSGAVFFGEMTFFPENGIASFDPEDWDLRLGEMLELPQIP